MFLFCSHGVKRTKTTFSATLEAEKNERRYVHGDGHEQYPVSHCAMSRRSEDVPFYHRSLTSDEARRIAKAITRLPEFLMQRQIPKQARSFFYLESQPDRVEVEA